jgi:hypothetical protein
MFFRGVTKCIARSGYPELQAVRIPTWRVSRGSGCSHGFGESVPQGDAACATYYRFRAMAARQFAIPVKAVIKTAITVVSGSAGDVGSIHFGCVSDGTVRVFPVS